MGARVLALSTDSLWSHKVFCQTSPAMRNVRYPLVSDRNGEISWLYGSLEPESGVSRRLSVLITPEGKVAFYLMYPPHVGRSSAELLRLVQAVLFNAQTGLGVPANWQPGQPGLQRDIRGAGRI